MTRPPAFFFLLSVFMILCQAAPINRRASSSAPSSTSASGPLPSATQQNGTAPNWAAYANGTTGFALHRLLTSIAPDAPQRWVTAGPISSTQIGGSDPAGRTRT
ncbi:hypothetical protein B0H17DRAFT_1208862 [Mycena rosella]|uniref:Uncharacterized protein n=1 Tax=Mycena rosella TaxID=1033263 RepID=A0AAD7D3L6_MYCRO|nr:hypothetical protein B0H17DRAFT_1208862 [Mycena rosella]